VVGVGEHTVDRVVQTIRDRAAARGRSRWKRLATRLTVASERSTRRV